MRKTIIMGVAIALFSMAGIVNAQIGVDLEDVAKEMTAAKTQWSKDVELDSIFPKYEGVLYSNKNFFCNYNLLGDTVILTKNDTINLPRWLERGGDENFYPFIEDKPTGIMPAGSYVISGYVFFRENSDSLCAMLKIPQQDYVHGVDYTKTRIMHGQEVKLMADECAFIKLTGIDSSNNKYVVYLTGTFEGYHGYHYYFDNFVIKKYYDLVSSTFLNKKVFCLNKKGDHYSNLSTGNNIVLDAATGKEIVLKDTSFYCKRVIVTKDAAFLLLLEGKQTGSFALEIERLGYEYLDSKSYRNARWFGYDNLFPNYYEKGAYENTVHLYACYRSSIYMSSILWIITEDDYVGVLKDKKQAVNQEKVNSKIKAQEQQQKVQRERAEKRQQFIAKYGAEMGQLINDGNIRIGMTKAMCKDAWGTPWNTYRTTTAFGTSEVWVYNYKTRVYFQNNKIVKIKD